MCGPRTSIWKATSTWCLAPRRDQPLILRNNGDGTFTALRLFDRVAGLRAFAWGDVDADGVPDAVLLDATGTVHVYANQRAGQFQAHALPQELGEVLAMALADVNSDSVLDLVVLQADGTIQRLSHAAEGTAWRLEKIAQWPDFPRGIAVATAALAGGGSGQQWWP